MSHPGSACCRPLTVVSEATHCAVLFTVATAVFVRVCLECLFRCHDFANLDPYKGILVYCGVGRGGDLIVHVTWMQKELRDDYAGYKKKVARCVARSLEE